MRALAIMIAIAGLAHAEPNGAVRVIINPSNSAVRLDHRFVADAFLKKRTRWDDDHAIQPADLSQKSGVRDRFSRDVLERDVASVRRYWAQQVFSGHGVPPPELASETDVVKYVAAHPGAIGYVGANVALTGVKVVEVE
jgi:ABC-type phosphate transport system substrate-binding protein